MAADDRRVAGIRPLHPPAVFVEELPVSERAARTVVNARAAAGSIVRGEDQRLLVVVGPCSIHDPRAAVEYASGLRDAAARYADDLLVLMRVYFEKPRTTVGWKGLVNDPDLDGTFSINRGLRIARKLLLDLAELEIASATELLDTITPQFIADLISWGAIGARTTESHEHRALASGLSMPVGFKNGTGGDVGIAVDAVRTAREPHRFLTVTDGGSAAIVATRGNPDCHVILRGGKDGPNYSAEHVARACQHLVANELPARLMIDCSHGNSSKDHARQPLVARDIAERIAAGSHSVLGVMIESHLVGGRQDHAPGKPLVYGQSITDACLAWSDTLPVLETLARAARARRGRGRIAPAPS